MTIEYQLQDALTELNFADRVRQRAAPKDNRKVDEAMIDRLIAAATLPETIDGRIRALDQAWSIERSIEMQASITALLGLVLGRLVNRNWYWLTVINQFFLLQHASGDWCPPLALHRALGARTRREIEVEIAALKALRGDFGTIQPGGSVLERVEAALSAAARRS